MYVPNYSYKDAKIDEFYYVNETEGSSNIIPLIKPFDMMKSGSPQEWVLATYYIPNELGNAIYPIKAINASQTYIYGFKSFQKGINGPEFNSPEKWFIINTQEKKLIYFDKESDFKSELKKLKLPDDLLIPDGIYEQYKNDRILPWFPDNIKKQLEEIKEGK